MKVTIDFRRVLHLILLVATTWLAGRFFVDQFEMSNLTAYGLGCFLVCQISNVFMKVLEGQTPTAIAPTTRGNGNEAEAALNKKK